MATVKKGFEKIEKLCLLLSVVALSIMMIWIFIDVIMRYFFNSPIPGTMELTGEYFMVVIVYLGISYTLKHNGHVKVDLIEAKFPYKIRIILSIFKDMMVFLILGLMLISNVNLSFDYFARGIRSVGSIEYLIAPAFIIMAIGVAMVIVRLFFNICENVAKLSKDHQVDQMKGQEVISLGRNSG